MLAIEGDSVLAIEGDSVLAIEGDSDAGDRRGQRTNRCLV
jgi:hypothetical protein